MSLFDKLKKIDTNDWQYYTCEYIFNNFEQAYQNADTFVQSFFRLGGKSNFIPNTIFNYENSAEYKIRIKHVVSSFFLGIYLFNQIDFLQPGKTSYLTKSNNREFLWAWFLCSLYHDAFYNIENDITDNEELRDLRECKFDYCKYSNYLLYNENTLRKYYDKNRKRDTSFDGGIHFDHGILAAENLYKNYIAGLTMALQNGENNIEYFFTDEGVTINGGRLKFNHEHFIAICKIAKIIASHNVFICDENSCKNCMDEKGKKKCKYKKVGLYNLVNNDHRFAKMPHNFKNGFNDYEKIYYLLSLVDNIEPTKRDIDLNTVDVEVFTQEPYKYCLKVVYNNPDDIKKVDNIKNMPAWLDYITVEDKENSMIITLDFSSLMKRKYFYQ